MRAGELREVREALLAWYAVEARDFPWRRTRDPYAVLVSEVMLQQTQASRVAERFPAFVARFPTPGALAAASEAEVLAAWNGLGYNRRALALRRAAIAVGASGWPWDVAGLARLPGVGPYTARAVASLAFGQPVGVVDTNVRRWLVRRFGVAPHDTAALQRLADALALAGPDGPTTGDSEVAAWTHATMELGAVCTARRPLCQACPIRAACPGRSRDTAVTVPRQAAFGGSRRAARGLLVRLLAGSRRRALREASVRRRLTEAGLRMDRDGWRQLLAELERDGLVHRVGGELRLGGGASPADTIAG